ncbi:MAG: hypothetical protein PF904_09705 [Kiritimatiellae bacterium]|jgi:hypothetical protein|nr:hypothetical protein [Kiritimatiellia bacterium]
MKRIWIKIIAFFPLGDVTVLIADGRALCKRGSVRKLLLSELTDLARSNQISDGCIHISSTDNAGCKLSFYGIPVNQHQRLRNVWAANWR